MVDFKAGILQLASLTLKGFCQSLGSALPLRKHAYLNILKILPQKKENIFR